MVLKKLRQRLPRFQRPGQNPHLERNRAWHDPVIEIYDTVEPGFNSGAKSAVKAYDVANRRWYNVCVDAAASDEWMASMVAKHIRAYHKGHRRQPRWNTIRTTLKGSPVAYDTQPEEDVCHLITERLEYGGGPEDRFPIVQWKDIKEKTYLSKGADLCSWDGKQVVFKRIEFDADIAAFERAIRNREKLIKCIEDDVDKSKTNIYSEMERRFNVVPIHAVVVRDDDPGPWAKGTVAGVLMPFAGSSLDALAGKGQVAVSEPQLLDLTRGIRELNRFDVVHGDICDWNVALQPGLDLSKSGVGGGRLLLLDLGNVAPDYEGDAKALAKLFLWCVDHSNSLRSNTESRDRIEHAAFTLKTKEDFDMALQELETGKKGKDDEADSGKA